MAINAGKINNSKSNNKLFYIGAAVISGIIIIIMLMSIGNPEKEVEEIMNNNDCDKLNIWIKEHMYFENFAPKFGVEINPTLQEKIIIINSFCGLSNVFEKTSSKENIEKTDTIQTETKKLELKVEEKIRIDGITTNKQRYHTGDEAIITVELTNSMSKKVIVYVVDSENNILHDEIITTNKFGIGTANFLVPVYYGMDETIQVITTMVNDESGEKIKKSLSISAEPILVKFTVDKEKYSVEDEIIITAITIPPTEIIISTTISRCLLTDFNGYENNIIIDSEGKGSATSKIRASPLDVCPEIREPITTEIQIVKGLFTEVKTTSESQEFIINPNLKIN